MYPSRFAYLFSLFFVLPSILAYPNALTSRTDTTTDIPHLLTRNFEPEGLGPGLHLLLRRGPSQNQPLPAAHPDGASTAEMELASQHMFYTEAKKQKGRLGATYESWLEREMKNRGISRELASEWDEEDEVARVLGVGSSEMVTPLSVWHANQSKQKSRGSTSTRPPAGGMAPPRSSYGTSSSAGHGRTAPATTAAGYRSEGSQYSQYAQMPREELKQLAQQWMFYEAAVKQYSGDRVGESRLEMEMKKWGITPEMARHWDEMLKEEESARRTGVPSATVTPLSAWHKLYGSQDTTRTLPPAGGMTPPRSSRSTSSSTGNGRTALAPAAAGHRTERPPAFMSLGQTQQYPTDRPGSITGAFAYPPRQ